MTKINTIPELIEFLEVNQINDAKAINEMVKGLTGCGFFIPLLFQGDEPYRTEYFTHWLRKHQEKIENGWEIPFFIDIDYDFNIKDIYKKRTV
jgi:hypothetical protein